MISATLTTQRKIVRTRAYKGPVRYRGVRYVAAQYKAGVRYTTDHFFRYSTLVHLEPPPQEEDNRGVSAHLLTARALPDVLAGRRVETSEIVSNVH